MVGLSEESDEKCEKLKLRNWPFGPFFQYCFDFFYVSPNISRKSLDLTFLVVTRINGNADGDHLKSLVC